MAVVIDGIVYVPVEDADGLGDWFALLDEEDLLP